MRIILVSAVCSCLLFAASCAQGVAVPADFPVKITLPAGSEIQEDPGGTDNSEMAMKMVYFKCSAGKDSVTSHITSQLEGEGFSKMNIPGMGDMGQDTFTKEGSNLMVSFSAMPGDSGEYMLMSMEMPDFSNFRP